MPDNFQKGFQFSVDDSKLLQFLRGCKFSLERSKEKMDLYNSCRSPSHPLDQHEPRATLPDWFFPWDPSSPIFQLGVSGFLDADYTKNPLSGTGCPCLAMTGRAGRLSSSGECMEIQSTNPPQAWQDRPWQNYPRRGWRVRFPMKINLKEEHQPCI